MVAEFQKRYDRLDPLDHLPLLQSSRKSGPNGDLLCPFTGSCWHHRSIFQVQAGYCFQCLHTRPSRAEAILGGEPGTHLPGVSLGLSRAPHSRGWLQLLTGYQCSSNLSFSFPVDELPSQTISSSGCCLVLFALGHIPVTITSNNNKKEILAHNLTIDCAS